MSKSKHPWRSALLALTVALALAACSKGKQHDPQVDESHGGHVHAPAPVGPPAAPAKPHGNHDAAHGGLVLMDATYHVELVLDPASGKHRVYVSDGARAPLPARTFDQVTLTVAGEQLAMVRAADDQAWEVTGKPVATTGVKVSLGYGKGGQETARFADLPIEAVLRGTLAPPGEPAGEHDHAEAGEHDHRAPHGGLVKSTTGGHLELVADASGKFQVWLLDEQLATRPIADASVRIKVAAKDYADVTAVARGDHFEGVGAALPGEHAVAIVTATVGGKTETARFELHLETGAATGHHHDH